MRSLRPSFRGHRFRPRPLLQQPNAIALLLLAWCTRASSQCSTLPVVEAPFDGQSFCTAAEDDLPEDLAAGSSKSYREPYVRIAVVYCAPADPQALLTFGTARVPVSSGRGILYHKFGVGRHNISAVVLREGTESVVSSLVIHVRECPMTSVMSVVTTHDPAFTVAFNGRIILTLEVQRWYGRRGKIQLSAAGLDEIRPIVTYALEFSSMTNEVFDIGVKVLPHALAPRAPDWSRPRKPGTAPSPSVCGLGPAIAEWCPSGAHLRRAHTGRTAEVEV